MHFLTSLSLLCVLVQCTMQWDGYDDDIREATDCVHSFVSNQRKNGSFSSPQYPAPYPNDITCKYVFSGSGRERVQIKFVDLDLNYPAGDPHDPYDCEDTDSITVRVKINGENKEIGVYCGKKRPPTIMSSGNDMEVFFTSKTSSTTKGFNATFNFVEDFGIKTGKQDNSLVCGFEYYSDVSPNGTFTSPNYPGLYPRNTECHYLFFGRSTEKNERVSITFAYFDVEGIAPACLEDNQSDYVEFSNFNVEDRKMRRLCGSGIDKAMRMVESDGNFFRVTFKSNEVYDAMGFEAYYQFKQVQECMPAPAPVYTESTVTTAATVAATVSTVATVTTPDTCTCSCQCTP